MTLPELSIKRHVLAWMLSAVLVLFGIISYQRIGVDRLPFIEFPIISVTTTLKGANPEIIDTSITNLIETSVNSVPGIEHIQSTSSPGASNVTITFALDKRIDVAFNEVQAKVNQVMRRLPEDADPPVVAKVETGASPIMWLALRGDRTQQQLNQYALNVLKKKLETINGVGEVRLGGRRDRTIRVNLIPAQMAAFAITAQDMQAAFDREHLQVAGGFLVGIKSEHLFKLDMEFHKLTDLQEMIISYRNKAPVRLKDVAEVEDGLGDFRQLARFNGKPTVGLGLIKVTNANTVAIIEEAKRRLDEEIRPQLPPGMTLEVASNDALYIQEIIKALKEHLILGTLLAALIVLFFLRSLRATLIISLAIPVSLMGAVAVMYFAGFTFNIMTLLALLLLIGVVVDDSIVVLENIHRHREKVDPDPISAALSGSKEVVFAVLAATFSLVCIFAPVIFLSGIIGQFFKSFAVVVTFGVLVSLFVSVTLTPMLCSRYLNVGEKHGRLYFALDRFFARMDEAYAHLLRLALQHRWKVVLITVLTVLSSAWFFQAVKKEFVPQEDEGRFIINMKTPLGSSIEYTSSRLLDVEKVLSTHPEIATYFTAIGFGQSGQVNQAFANVRMQDRDQRNIKQQETIKQLREELARIPGIKAFPAPVPLIQGQRGDPLQFNLSGPNLDQVASLARALQEKINNDPSFGKMDLDVQLDLPQLIMQLDRTRAASLGLTAQDVALTLSMLTGGVDVARYNDQPGDGERYVIRIKAKDGEFRQPSDMSKIFLRTKNGEMVRLDSVASFKQELGAVVIARYDLQYAANFSSTPLVPLGDAVTKVRETAAQLLPPGYSIKFIGQAEEFEKTKKTMTFTFALAMILLYMVLASQFNSFLQPFIIMLAQPLAIIGGVAALWLTGHTLNIFSMIGLVLLIGLVAKNSILLVDLTNQLREKGTAIDDALREACPIRLRPVLMTSATIILALLPAALGFGAGTETNGPLSVAVIGGMITSTLLTLVVVPAVYSLVLGWQARRKM
ncbi:MAG: efflux RND transporter permease subunit [Methylophilaceae bacterium]